LKMLKHVINDIICFIPTVKGYRVRQYMYGFILRAQNFYRNVILLERTTKIE